STDWVKIKRERDEDFVVLGWLPRKGAETSVGALCLGTYGPVEEGSGGDGAERLLRYRGRVGSGFDASTLRDLEKRLAPLARDPYDWPGATAAELKHVRYVRPELVAQVRFAGWTDEGRVRAAVFQGLRADVAP